MNRFVLDCSVAMAWCFEDEADSYSEKILNAMSESESIVSSLWFLEVANVLLMAERHKRITEADSLRFIELLRSLPITEDEELTLQTVGAIISVGREYNLTSYDAAYLELAMRQGLSLATRDKKLLAACRKCGIQVFR